MVFFTCAGCGESLKKAQVEKHRFRCRRSQLLTCIDCCKDFHNDDYQTHLKCISEDQKYGGQNYVAKENKGEVKQQKWFDLVQMAIDKISAQQSSAASGDRRLKPLLENIRNYPNIPQKEKKFKNFVANSLRVRDENLVTRAWNAIKSISDEIRPAPSSLAPPTTAKSSDSQSSPSSTETKSATMNDGDTTLEKIDQKQQPINDELKGTEEEKEEVASASADQQQSILSSGSKGTSKKKRKKTDSQSDATKNVIGADTVEAAENGTCDNSDRSEKVKDNEEEDEPAKKKKKKKSKKENNVAESSDTKKDQIEPRFVAEKLLVDEENLVADFSVDASSVSIVNETAAAENVEEVVVTSAIVGDDNNSGADDATAKLSLKSLVKKLLKEAENQQIATKRLKKMACKIYGYEMDEQKRALAEEIDSFLQKNARKFVTDGKIVRFADKS